MATRPNVLPQLASLDVNLPNTGNVNKLRPPLEVREAGYDYLQKPPAEEFNWIINNISEWIDYLDSLTRDQGITEVASKDQAEQGVATDVLMTPQRTLQSIQFNAVPPGNVQYTARTDAPSGWLYCDGSAVSRTTYSRLFSAIGTTFGTGDGSTTFNLPDLRDEFIRGANAAGGRTVGTTESDSLGSHTHSGTTASAGSHNHLGGIPYLQTYDPARFPYGLGGTTRLGFSAGNLTNNAKSPNTSTAGAHTHSFTTNATGGSETRPQNVALLPIIKI